MRTMLVAVLAAALLSSAASAQVASEQFIPIGQSPGALTMQGEVQAAAAPAVAGGEGSVAMTSEAAPDGVSYLIGPRTRIYIDRSALGRPNTMGALADIQPGRAIEVSVPTADTRVASWIKVRATD